MKCKTTLRLLPILAAVFLVAPLVLAGSAGHVDWSALEGATNYVPGQLLVGFKSPPADPQAVAAAEEARARLHAAVGATVLNRFTLIPCDQVKVPEGLTLAEIGEILGVTESRVCQIHTKAILQLRARMAEPPV